MIWRNNLCRIAEVFYNNQPETGMSSLANNNPLMLELNKAFTLMESGPVVLVTTHDGQKDNIMTIR